MIRRNASRRLAILAAAASTFAMAGSTALAQGTYVAQNNLVCVQFESGDLTGSWDRSTSTPGWTDDGYIIWNGPNLFDQPGAQGIFGFDFEVQVGGTYQFRMRNRHENSDPTEENDVWIRMDGGPWVKTFSNGPGSVGSWTWESRFDFDHNNQPDASYPLSSGTHRIEFSGRSFGFKMDSFHLYLGNAPGALNPSTPESPRRFGEQYCSANNNSTGQASSITAFGSPELDDNDFTLTCNNLPANQFGLWIASGQQGFSGGLSGTLANLCMVNPGRYASIVSTGTSGQVTLDPNLTSLPRPTGNVMAQVGSTQYFQFWHRDTVGQANMSRGFRFQVQ